MMIDPFVILAPILLLGVVALLGFVGCAEMLGIEDWRASPENQRPSNFPTVAAVNGKGTTATTSHMCDLPLGIEGGDLLLVFFSVGDTTASLTWPSGWTELYSVNNGHVSDLRYRVADGSEGSNITIVSSPATSGSFTIYRITGHAGSAPESATAMGTSMTSDPMSGPNPPQLFPSWGAEATLWIAAMTFDDGTATISDPPLDYTNIQLSASGDAPGTTTVTAQRTLNAPSDDPGTFTTSVSDQWVAATVAVRPYGP